MRPPPPPSTTTSSILITRTSTIHNRNPSSQTLQNFSSSSSPVVMNSLELNNHIMLSNINNNGTSPTALFNNNGSSSSSTSTGNNNNSNNNINNINNTNGNSDFSLLSSSSSNGQNSSLLSGINNNNNTSPGAVAEKEKEMGEFPEADNRLRSAADVQCWNTFVLSSWVAVTMFVVLIWSQWRQTGGQVQTHSMEYFILCMIGGVLSGFPHFLLTPFDQIKCRMQTGEFATAVDGFKHIWYDPAHRGSLTLRVTSLYRGWVPTLVGYSLQGATKFGLYEYLKWALKAYVGYEAAARHQVVLFLAASAAAEFCADVLLAPWEAIKVKVQTNVAAFSGNAALTSHIVPRIYATEGLHGFFKGLPPLWMRQVPYTMAKFATFEKTVEFIYFYVLGVAKAQTSPFVQLVVSVVSGFIAGFFCTLVSHPADTVVSKLNQKNDGRVGAWQVVQDLGCSGLWKGLLARIMFVGTLTAMQWLIYDSFKVLVGLQTTGGGGGSSAKSVPHGASSSGLLDGVVGSPIVHGAEHHVRHFQQQQQQQQNGN